jgi:hypothetical protein
MEVKLKLAQQTSRRLQCKSGGASRQVCSKILFRIKSVKESRALALGQAFKGSNTP